MDIKQLDETVCSLDNEERKMFYRTFSYEKRIGTLSFPKSFEEKAYKYLKVGDESPQQTLERVTNQTIIRTFNNYTGGQAQFNEIRTSKPGSEKPKISEEEKTKVYKQIDQEHADKRAQGKCDFCEAEKYTATDLEERLDFPNCKSGANLAKYDSENGLIILNESNPLKITRDAFSDCFSLAEKWFKITNQKNPERTYPFLGWNCLRRAGASQLHSHMHMLLAPSHAYEEAERMKWASNRYRKDTCSNYFEDIFYIHDSLGLRLETHSSKVLASLVPKKDKEVWIIGDSLENIEETSFNVVRCFIDNLGVQAFNFAVQMPPIHGALGWEDFPYIAHIVDRGPASKKGTDIAIMELFGTSIIGYDPFKIASFLKEYL